MPQNPIATLNVNDGTQNKLWITGPGATVVKAQPGMIASMVVEVAGSATGNINDAATTAAVTTGNQVAVIPTTVGVTKLNFPCLAGIVVTPGTGQAVSVAYR